MPLTMPLPKYLTMPSRLEGAELCSESARNWDPNCLSCTHRPSAVSHSPAQTEGSEPTTVIGSRLPRAATLRTAKPLSSLKKTTRSIRPDRLSGAGESGLDNPFSSGDTGREITAPDALMKVENRGADS